MIDDLIQNGEYYTALMQLDNTDDEKTRLYRLICLNALGEYEQARKEGLIAKENARETYYDVIAQYVVSLKETERYEEAIDLLIEELSMPYIPYNYEMAYNTAYDELLLAKQEANNQIGEKNQIFSTSEIAVLLERDDVNEDVLYMALEQLQQLNIRMLLPVIERYLRNPHKSSFSKTLIIEIMIEQQIDEEFEIYKNNHIYYINPSYASSVLAQDCYSGIGQEIVRVLENDNPSLMNQCLDFLEYYLYSVYPKEIYEDVYSLVAATIHYYVATLSGIPLENMDIEIDYNVDFEEVEEQLLALKEIE